MGKPVTHYDKDGGPACGMGQWIRPSQLTTSLLEVTCKNCHHSNVYREAVTAAAKVIRHELPGQAVLNPEFLP